MNIENNHSGAKVDVSSTLIQLVSFKIGEEEFGVDITKVQEIIRMVDITRVPNAPHFVEGVINLRGKVIPIIDMRKRLELDSKDYDKDTRIVVVEIEGKIVGFIVDSVSEVLRINQAVTEAPPPMVAGINSEFITSIAKLDDRLLILLDLERVLTSEEKGEMSELA